MKLKKNKKTKQKLTVTCYLREVNLTSGTELTPLLTYLGAVCKKGGATLVYPWELGAGN